MQGGTLLVSRYVKLFPQLKKRLEALGFPNVNVTGSEKDELNMLINELKPKYLIMSSNFYNSGTPYRVKQLIKVFPKLNISIINTAPFSDVTAAWFVFYGIKAYIKLSDGLEEFDHGLKCILDGKNYVAPDVQKIIDGLSEWPDVKIRDATLRQRDVLLMLCNGLSIKSIVENLYISKATVELHIKDLLKIFHCSGREELIKTAFCLDIFTKDDLCFCDTNFKIDELPNWAKTQITMNKEQLKMRNEKLGMLKNLHPCRFFS